MGLRDIVILLPILISMPVALVKPWIGILSWTWIGLMNPHRLSWALTQFPVAQGVAIAILAGTLFTKDRRLPPQGLESFVLFALVVCFTITTAFSWYPQVSWVQWEKVMKILLFTFLTMMLIHEWFRVRMLMLVIVGSIGFYGVKGGIFSILTGGQYRVWGPPGSFIGDNTAMGLVLCMILPMAFYAARAEQNKWVRRALYAVFFLSVPAILFTYSRGAFLGLIAVSIALLWRYKIWGAVLLVIGILVFPIVKDVLPEQWVSRQQSTLEYKEDRSAMQRIQAWGVATNIALDRPLLGAGFNFEYAQDTPRWLSYANFVEPWASEERAAHSIYFQLLGQHGVVVLILFVTLLLGAFYRLYKLSTRDYPAEYRWIALYAKGTQLALVPYMLAGAFLSLAYFDMFYLCVAMSAILNREAARVPLSNQMGDTASALASDGREPEATGK